MSRYLVLAIVLTLLVTSCLAEGKGRKHKKVRKPVQAKHVGSSELDMLEKDEEFKEKEQELREREEAARLAEQARIEARAEDNRVEPPIEDACDRVHCGAGRVCTLTSTNTPECTCIEECTWEKDPRRRVCTNHNETWGSDCHVYQHRCWCDDKDVRCQADTYKHVHIEYYGECREMPECQKEEMDDFPRRMSDWLFNVMRDLADRHELSPHYLAMERSAESNMTRRWAKAAVWKWCDLDGHPHDRSVSRHELFPIRAPLMSLEHCIAPFLDSCDNDGDHRISLSEWAGCLRIDQAEIEDECENLNDEDE